MFLEHFQKEKKKLITCLTFCLVTCQQYQLRDIQRQVNVGFWASASTFKQYPVSIPGRYYCCYDLLHPSFRKPFSVNPLMIQPHPFCCLHWRSLKTPFQILSRTLFLISVMVIHEGAGDSLNGGNFYSSELRLKYFSLFFVTIMFLVNLFISQSLSLTHKYPKTLDHYKNNILIFSLN